MTRQEIFIRDNYTCQVCGKHININLTPQLGHVIPQRKWIIKKYGKDIIHSSYNLVSVCSLKCNSSVDIGCNEIAIEKKIKEIVKKCKKDLT